MTTKDTPSNRLSLILVASPRARLGPGSHLHRLLIDHTAVLRRYVLCTTAGTGKEILATGLFTPADLNLCRPGTNGGLAELAALVARRSAQAVILLLDPGDPWIDAVEVRALKRVCIQLQTRMISTYAAADRWLLLEAPHLVAPTPTPGHQASVEGGVTNVTTAGEPLHLEISERTLALIAHDHKKLEMVEFANRWGSLIGQHRRVLTTGTTGTLLKLLFASPQYEEELLAPIENTSRGERLRNILLEIIHELEIDPKKKSIPDLLLRLRTSKAIRQNQTLSEKIIPLPSGPLGGDVLIAEAVLNHECHTIIFFHDPETAHPHNDDIRLLEHTCQLPSVFAECVSDSASAVLWGEGLEKEVESGRTARSLASLLREHCQSLGVRSFIVLPRSDDDDGVALGTDLARAAAGHFHLRLLELAKTKGEIRVGIAWGWGARAVITALKELESTGAISRSDLSSCAIVWSPLIGSVGAEITELEASVIAEDFAGYYGGTVEGFPCAGFAKRSAALPSSVVRLLNTLEDADLILTAAAPWQANTTLLKDTGRDPKYFPSFDQAVGLVSGVFLQSDGTEVDNSYRIVGLQLAGFQRAAARGAVILMCGGTDRRPVLLAALKAHMVSTVITTSQSGEWLQEALVHGA